ncbi:piwi A [Pelomyxa schiedti]|nr:piwi A [Pelomyxa schiedti]
MADRPPSPPHKRGRVADQQPQPQTPTTSTTTTTSTTSTPLSPPPPPHQHQQQQPGGERDRDFRQSGPRQSPDSAAAAAHRDYRDRDRDRERDPRQSPDAAAHRDYRDRDRDPTRDRDRERDRDRCDRDTPRDHQHQHQEQHQHQQQSHTTPTQRGPSSSPHSHSQSQSPHQQRGVGLGGALSPPSPSPSQSPRGGGMGMGPGQSASPGGDTHYRGPQPQSHSPSPPGGSPGGPPLSPAGGGGVGGRGKGGGADVGGAQGGGGGRGGEGPREQRVQRLCSRDIIVITFVAVILIIIIRLRVWELYGYSVPHISSLKPRRPNAYSDELVVGLPAQPTQPADQSSWRPSTCCANHFKFGCPITQWYQYSVAFAPSIPHRGARIGIMYDNFADILGPFVFDGAMLFATKKAEDTKRTITTKGKSVQDVTITLTFTNSVVTPATPQILQVYNILLRKAFVSNMRLKSMGRNWFDDQHPIQIREHNVELWRGVSATLSMIKAGVSLNVDVSFRTIRVDTAADVVSRCRGDKEKATQLLQGQTVLTRYTRQNSKTHLVSHIDWEMSPSSVIPDLNITFRQYYVEHYNIKLHQEGPPLLAIQQGAHHIYLMPELCYMTGITDEMRKNFRVMKALAEHTRLSAGTRARNISEFISALSHQDELKKYSIEIPARPLPVSSMKLMPETVHFKTTSYSRESPNWSGDSQRGQPTNVVNPASLYFVYPNRCGAVAKEFHDTLRRIATPMNIVLPEFTRIGLDNDNAYSYVGALREQLVRAVPDLVICLLPNEQKERYDEIKRLLTVDYPCPSQMVLMKSIEDQKKLLTICTRVAHQITCKLGGQLWNCNIPLKSTMIVGVDVCHSRGKSVAAMCGTINETFNKYYSVVAFQERNQEVSTFLKQMMHSILQGYFQANNSLPGRIIVYRDGVGDGMLKSVVEIEIAAVEEAFKMFSSATTQYKPQMTFIVVKKKVHTRVFAERDRQVVNVEAGTVCPGAVTHKDWYDFYLLSNQVTQGSAMPTHFHVIRDSGFLSSFQLYSLTFKLTHLYFNWPGTVRVPAPCMYAHKLAFLIGQSVHREPNTKLCDKLFFL